MTDNETEKLAKMLHQFYEQAADIGQFRSIDIDRYVARQLLAQQKTTNKTWETLTQQLHEIVYELSGYISQGEPGRDLIVSLVKIDHTMRTKVKSEEVKETKWNGGKVKKNFSGIPGRTFLDYP